MEKNLVNILHTWYVQYITHMVCTQLLVCLVWGARVEGTLRLSHIGAADFPVGEFLATLVALHFTPVSK